MSNRDGVPEVVWALACWRNDLAFYSIKMGNDLFSTSEAAKLTCAQCKEAGEGDGERKCMYELKDQRPIRLWPARKAVR